LAEPEIEDKRITLAEAAKMVPDGSGLFWGGFGFQRPPIAFASELIRQKKRNLTIYTRRVAEGKVEIEDYSNLAMAMRFLGGALNVPFMPLRSMMGTDMVAKSRYKGDKKLKVIDCPFTGDKICLVPSIQPDFSIIHVQRVDMSGNAQIDGVVGEDLEGSRCGKKLIILAEELVDEEEIRFAPEQTKVPAMYVDHVVITPFVAHPMMCHGVYDYDLEFLQMFHKITRKEETWQEYLDTYILGVENHEAYLDKIGWSRLNKLRAIKPRGY
jgi:glutaconate CoA-transferase subunit A